MDKPWSNNSTQLLQEIDRKMSMIESILQQISGPLITAEIYEIHHILLEVSQLLLALQQNPKMGPLVKELSLQLQTIREQYNQLFCREQMHYLFSE
ncbi:hypothetical protein [Bacillus toyonensis]|uniref:hypothetical protein n=1 Tax=Bacillus toyonensis TaxID=155322 RepID=UPI000BFBC166|nr:hypothetical protein [Bacillus toyonensis]PHG62852.1 hypothetical protein COI59_19655 [Bacillus toyonensis]